MNLKLNMLVCKINPTEFKIKPSYAISFSSIQKLPSYFHIMFQWTHLDMNIGSQNQLQKADICLDFGKD